MGTVIESRPSIHSRFNVKHERNTNLRNVFVTSFAVIETVSVFRRKQMARAHAYGEMEGARDLRTDLARQLNRDKGALVVTSKRWPAIVGLELASP